MSRTSQLPNLDKLFKDEDDQDFTPLGGSNLAAIFGAPSKLGDASASVKQPLQKKPSGGRSTPQAVQQTANKTEVIVANAVHAYKLENGLYSLIGKVGIALTGNIVTRIYQIILYRSKTEHISVVTLNPEFAYTIRENNYATYYDDKGENWSLLFQNEESCVQFSREIGVSRFLSRQTKPDDSVMHQNLTVQSKGLEAQEGDGITVKTTICTNLSQPLNFSSSPTQIVNVEISQDDNWERSLLNCSKGLKRLLILPPSKQISLGPGFPREKEIIMEIEVIDVVRPEAKSFSPITKPPVTGKASILSRMAKMGQSMLPKAPTSTTTDSEDTEEEVHVKSPRRFKPEVAGSYVAKHQSRASQESMEEIAPTANVVVPRSVVPTLTHRPIMQQSAFSSPWPGGAIQQQYVTMDGQYYPVHQVPVAQPMPAAMDPNINILLSETRTQNSEIRMGMSKIADNVQKLLDKFHVIEMQSASSPSNERAMEASLKMLMALNATQNLTANGKSETNPAVDSSGEERSKELITKLENELKKAKQLLEEHAKKIGDLEGQKQEWGIQRNELREKNQRLEKSLADSQTTAQKALNDLSTANDTARKENANLEAKILKLNSEKNILEKAAANAASENTETAVGNDKATEIKRIMNKTYQTLVAKFTEDSYTTEYIKQTVANTIRNITLQVLKEGRSDEKSESNVKADRKSREAVSDPASKVAPSDSIIAVDSDNDKSSVSLPVINDTNSSAVTLTEIPVAQEEPPPIPPIDVDSEGDWLIP